MLPVLRLVTASLVCCTAVCIAPKRRRPGISRERPAGAVLPPVGAQLARQPTADTGSRDEARTGDVPGTGRQIDGSRLMGCNSSVFPRGCVCEHDNEEEVVYVCVRACMHALRKGEGKRRLTGGGGEGGQQSGVVLLALLLWQKKNIVLVSLFRLNNTSL